MRSFRVEFAVLLSVFAAPLVAARADWPTFQFDPQRTGYSSSDALRMPLEKIWRVKIAREGWALAPAAVLGDRVYIGTIDGRLLALSRDTGSQIWSHSASGSIHLAPAVSEGKVVFGSAEGKLVALDAATGSVSWSFDSGSNIHGSPNIFNGKVWFGSNNGSAHALDLATGRLIWKKDLAGYLLASPAVDGARAYFAALDGRLFALKSDTGEIVWQASLPAETRASPSVAYGLVLVGSHDGVVRAFSTETGAAAWTSGSAGPIFGGLAIAGGSVFASSLDGNVRALSRLNGSALWKFEVGTSVHAVPTIVQGSVVFGADDGAFYVLDPSSGTLLFKETLAGRIAAPAALAAGRAYVFSDDGFLQAFRSPNQAPFSPVDLQVNGRVNPVLNADALSFSWTFLDPDTGDRQSAFDLEIGSASYSRASAESLFRLNASLPEGSYSWRVRTYDVAGASGPFSSGTDSFIVDRTVPLTAILSPSSQTGGICQVSGGRIPVVGTVQDPHLLDYELEFAPGANALGGFVLISSATVAVSSGALGIWDTGTLAGWHTLRLTARDQAGNTADARVNVFVGDPSVLLVLDPGTFNKPDGVGVGPDASIIVADSNNNRITVYSSSGAFIKNVDAALNKPKAVAADRAGNLYIADTNNSRVIKLSPDGAVLLQLGRRKDKKNGPPDYLPGKANGEFNKPSGVALDAAENLYVSDTNNHRIQKFRPDGSFLLAITLPAAPNDVAQEDDDEDTQMPELGEPMGIAIDGSGNIYVADREGDRVLKYSPSGALLATIESAGAGLGQLSNPRGVAVSADGDCILVSDRNNDRIQKFDSAGRATLAFGKNGKGDPASGIFFNKPAGLAMDSAGDLYIADRNNDRIQKLGASAAPVTIVSVGESKAEPGKKRISKRQGGRVQRGDGAGVAVPPEALGQDLEITVSTPLVRTELEEQTKKKKMGAVLAAVSEGVEYGPEGTVFSTPVTLTLPYDPAAVRSQGMNEALLQVYYWNRDKVRWEGLPSVVDAQARVVTAQTSHFSLYQVLGTLDNKPAETISAPAITADPTFAFREVFVFPNPAVRGAKPTIHFAVGLADRITIRIYDVAGRSVHQAVMDTPPSIISDASGARYAYEYAWDGRIPSGVYLYSITAEKSGFSPIRRSGKFAVVR